jgi:hypothetical protein
MPAMAGHLAEARFGELIRDLANAGRAISSYPPGHPAVAAGLARAHQALSSLLDDSGPIEIAAARDALLWNDRRFTTPQAVALARLLRRRRAAVLLLDPGVSAEELETFLRTLAVDVRSARESGSLAAELAAAGLDRLRVSDLDFSSLGLVEADEQPTAPEAGAFASRVMRRLLEDGSLPPKQAETWITSGKSAADLLQLLLDAGGATGPGAAQDASLAAAALRAAIATFVESPDAEGAAAIAAIHARLGGEGRDRLVRELAAAMAGAAPAKEALALLSAALPPQATTGLHQAMARAASLERGEAPDPDAAAPRMHPVQLASLRRAFDTEDVDTFRDSSRTAGELAALLELPDDPADRALSPAAAETGREVAGPSLDRDGTAALLELAERAEVSQEVRPHVLQRFGSGYLRQLSGGRVRKATSLLERVQRSAAGEGPESAEFRRTAEQMTGRESVEALVGSLAGIPQESFDVVPALVERMGPGAVPQLLDVLARTENRRTRHLLLDLLAKVGPAVARDATTMLADSRWYVVRNMLLLLRQVGDARSVPAVRRCVDHPDLRVRLEAIHTLFVFDRGVPRELLRRALHDPDLRQAEAAMELAGKFGIAEAVEPIVAYLRAWDPLGKRRAVRLKAIRALAAIGDPAALPGLGRFRARFHPWPPAIEERRELYRTLPAYPETSYRDWIVSGLRSRDPEIRRLSAAMGPAPEVAP